MAIKYEAGSIALSTVFTYILVRVVDFVTYPTREEEDFLRLTVRSNDTSKMVGEYREIFLEKMKKRYLISFVLVLAFWGCTLYYVTVYVSLFEESLKSWLTNCFYCGVWIFGVNGVLWPFSVGLVWLVGKKKVWNNPKG